MEKRRPLCLRCRAPGHVFNNCTTSASQHESEYLFSRWRMELDFTSAWESAEARSTRCEDLNLLDILDSYPPWNSQREVEKALEEGSDAIRNLGKTGSTVFWTDCHICYALFAMTPNPSSPDQDILLLPDWTLSRLTAEMGVDLDSEEKRKYATCLVVFLQPSSIALPLGIRAHRGDAMCLLEENLGYGRTLGGRRMSQNSLDLGVVQEWLSRCSRLHGTDCAPTKTKELDQIRLIDVDRRQIVAYPGSGCEYVALSYVWGGVVQRAMKLNARIGRLPRTLEDAVEFTKLLGLKFLWIDSVCIDQSNEEDKARQVNMMWSIYRGAFITLIACSGTSAESGISRLSRVERYDQVTCCIKGRRLVGLMPTLSQQNWVCPWSTRAWTLQEAMLSPRCLYLSDHQMIYDCTAMMCTESLNHSRSLVHGLTQASNPTNLGFVTWMMDQIGAGGYRNPLDDPAKRLQHWGMKVTLYSYRTMTLDADGLRAFEGILQRLMSMYPQGYIQGLPIEDLDWALVWLAQYPLERRWGFPSWTWAGWKGGVWYGQPRDVTKTRAFPTHLRIYKFRNGKLETLFKTDSEAISSYGTAVDPPIADPTFTMRRSDQQRIALTPSQMLIAEGNDVLLVDAICLHFTPDFSHPLHDVHISGHFEGFAFDLHNVRCFLELISVDQVIARTFDEDQTFLLISRESYGQYVNHHLLMIRYEKPGEAAVRATVLHLLIPKNRLGLLEQLSPRRRQVLLA